jgi:hypothetical protein
MSSYDKKNMVLPALFCLLLTSLCGCTAPLALQGMSSGVPVAFNSTGGGKGDSAWFARYDDVVQATLDAGQKLSFKLEKKTIGIDQSALNYIDEKGWKLEILIERRTETVTLAQFNVGLYGSKSIGRLMARQIVIEMAEAGKFLRDWHPAEDD